MDRLKNKINKIHPLSDETWLEFLKILEIKRYSAKHKLVELGNPTEDMYFSIDGITRLYSTCNKGNQINSLIFPKDTFVGAFACLIIKRPPLSELQCLTDCTMVQGNFYKFIELTDKYLDLSIFYRKSLEKFYISLENKDLELANMDASERYISLIQHIPKIESQISQKHIASHIGITNVQLSRIRKKLFRLKMTH